MRALDIVIDVDGTIADIVAGLELACASYGIPPLPEELRAHLGTSNGGKLLPEPHRSMVPRILAEPGFVIGLPWYDGAANFCQDLVSAGHNVIALTAPYDSHTWVPERFEWLRGILNHNEVIFCPSDHKDRVRADVLIEDRADIANAWAKAHPEGFAILVNRPWNEEEILEHSNMARRFTYGGIKVLIRMLAVSR